MRRHIGSTMFKDDYHDDYHVSPKMTGSHKNRIKYLLRKSPRSQSRLTENRKLSNVKGKTGKGRRRKS